VTRNFGIELSSGEIVILMTQDALPGNAYLIENLAAPFRDPLIAGAYARQVPRPEADLLTKRNLERWLTGSTRPEERRVDDKAHYNAMSAMDRYLLCNFDNVCSAIRRSVWERIKLVQTDFGEDIDWSKRVLEAGWKIYINPQHS
jgi:rhamnosyltransferase